MDKQQIYNFIFNNDELEKLKSRIGRFNPFKVLKIEDYEVRHSNMLGWLFNPNGNHNYDDRILKRFISKVLAKPENDETLWDTNLIYELNQKSLMDAKVFREFKTDRGLIDILVVSEQNKMIVYIENKFESTEHSNQLKKYYEYISKIYPSYVIIPIYLTIEGEEPSDKRYFIASYEDIIEVLEFITDNYKDRTSNEVIKFIEYYVQVIGSQLNLLKREDKA